MEKLVLSVVVLAAGPLLYHFTRGRPGPLALLDGFNVVAITGLILAGVLPEALGRGGLIVLAFAVGGLVIPTLLERQFQRAGRESHFFALVLGMLGLCLHCLADGAALLDAVPGALEGAAGHDHHHGHDGHSHGGSGHAHLPFAVILHRLPVGLTIWLLLRPKYGSLAAGGVLAMVAVSTVLGYALGSHVLPEVPPAAGACFEGLVAGSLMHVVLHGTHHDVHPGNRRWISGEGLGGVVGIGFVVVGVLGDLGGGVGERVTAAFVELALQSAPALVLGYMAAGLLHVFMPAASVRWMGRGSSASQALRGMAVGLPMPVCSCGVVPIYRSLVQRGVPATAALAFMVATPEIGVDAVLLSIPLLGVEMTVLRVAGAAIVALVVGWVVGRFAPRSAPGVSAEEHPAGESLRQRWLRAVRFAFGELVDHTAPWILVGLGIAALAEPLLDASWLRGIPASLQILAMAAIGIPVYVCAAGATPFVAVLMFKGVSPGAALAFLLTGPATNVTTFGVLSRLHGRRLAAVFSVSVLVLTVGLSFAVNALLPAPSLPDLAIDHGHDPDPLGLVCVAIFALLCIASVLRRGPREFVREVFDTGDEDGESGHSHSHDHDHG